MDADNTNTNKPNKVMLWVKRLGFVGFLFFLIKGLIWLAVLFFGGKALLGS